MAMKKQYLISKFHDEAYNLLELIKQHKEGTKEWREQYQRVFNSFKVIPNKQDDANNMDIEYSINWISYRLKKPLGEITKDELTKYLDSKLFSSPKDFDFYFRIGEAFGFTEGYIVGDGELYSFNKLPSSIQEYLKKQFSHRLEEDRKYTGEELEGYTKRREKEWYLHIQVQCVGFHKAIEKAIVNAKRNVNILKLYYDTHTFLYEFAIDSINSPFDYLIQEKGSTWTTGGYQYERRRGFFHRTDGLDQMVSDISSIVNSKNPTDLDKRIVNMIDIFGLIDDLTPLYVRFLVSIVSLENLLLDERDYLGWKLAEKISYLIGDTRAWFATYYGIEPENEADELTDAFIKENSAMARIALDRTIRRFYEKRSAIAHGGLEGSRNKRITANDYNLAISLVLWTVEKLLELRRNNGIEHIANKTTDTSEDMTSLNYYLEKMKYT
jgi:hypothetical protein